MRQLLPLGVTLVAFEALPRLPFPALTQPCTQHFVCLLRAALAQRWRWCWPGEPCPVLGVPGHQLRGPQWGPQALGGLSYVLSTCSHCMSLPVGLSPQARLRSNFLVPLGLAQSGQLIS